jgi:SAM-dependent methyltransferase
MPETGYIHGVHEEEQRRLAELNRLTNAPFLQYLALSSADRVLEVGSGLGLLANEAAQHAPQGCVIGVEFAPEQIGSARVLQANVAFTRGDGRHLPFAEGHFDVVYCRYVLEHVADPVTVLREMRRVLRVGGRALAQENNMRMVEFDPDCPRFEALLPQFCELQRRLGGDAFVGKRLYALFHAAGFRDIQLSYQPEIHPADSPTFRPWVDNFIELIRGASTQLLAHSLAEPAAIEGAMQELRELRQRDDATGLFHWNRATGVK